MSTFTARELAKEAEREVGMREAVYPGRVQKGLMSGHLAQRRLAMMEAIAAKLAAEAEAEEGASRLL